MVTLPFLVQVALQPPFSPGFMASSPPLRLAVWPVRPRSEKPFGNCHLSLAAPVLAGAFLAGALPAGCAALEAAFAAAISLRAARKPVTGVSSPLVVICWFSFRCGPVP